MPATAPAKRDPAYLVLARGFSRNMAQPFAALATRLAIGLGVS
jgi:hypothetical protein